MIMERAKHIARHEELLARASGDEAAILEAELADLRSFHPTVRCLGFFETAKPAQSEMGRVLLGDHPHESARYIAWHLELEHAPRKRPLEITIEWKMILEDGTLFTEQVLRTILLPEWSESLHIASWGWEKAGQWKKGKHKAVLALWGEPLTEGSFSIV
jgi:hypothetical protein